MVKRTRTAVALAILIAAALSLWTKPAQAQVELGENTEILEIHVPGGGGFDEELYPAHFPEEKANPVCKAIESVPHMLELPHEPMAKFFEKVFHTEHDQPKTELEEYAIGLQYVPERPPLLIEWNELFLGPGFLKQGIELPTGAVWRPAFWLFGEFRTAVQYTDLNRGFDPVSEWANRLDLFGQINLSGTERILIGMRPLDEERFDRREFASYDFRNGRWIDGENADFQTLFFEGDFGEIFPCLDPYDSKWLDIGFSVGRMPILAQQGLLINEDMIDAVTVTRNTIYGLKNLNLRATGFYAWDQVTRNSATTTRGNEFDPSSRVVGILTESDYRYNTFNLDVVYASSDNAAVYGDVLAYGISGIRRWHGHENTYNTSLHLLGSYPVTGRTDFADQGELLFAQTSWTPHKTEDLIYLNAFWAIDQYTSPTRGPLQGGALGQTGLLFSAPGLGRVGAPIGVRTNNRAGASLGYQMFFHHTREQVIVELGGHKETKGPDNTGALGLMLRYQRAFKQHFIFLVDGFVAKRESMNTSPGARAEIRIKF